ncbi:hypothetical protein JOQ06_015602 [Pogonophryne albipinna]|uniref:Uncharacterized protein n=1 Tax=Pogonophryne albipinna TaxID=1090488 RepID=A0AAD6ALQ5_9TELE|nr:hypothetical protein JOQ06_015602 [Pogonophryne albipinna]
MMKSGGGYFQKMAEMDFKTTTMEALVRMSRTDLLVVGCLNVSPADNVCEWAFISFSLPRLKAVEMKEKTLLR